MSVTEIRCPNCGNLLTKAEIVDGVIHGFCRKCKTQSVFRFERVIRIENGRIRITQKLTIIKGTLQSPRDVVE